MDIATPNTLSLAYLPAALMLGALHALEPGHAKALTAAYLIGIKGTKKDALLLGLSVAFTHSIVVIAISALALWLGREAFTEEITLWLQITSGVIVILLGFWMLMKRIKLLRRKKFRTKTVVRSHSKVLGRHAIAHNHDDLDDDAHARAHAADIPEYVRKGERPTLFQIIAFGAAGGMIPCPASITVMLLALSIGKFALGFMAVMGFSIGLAVTLVGIGLIVVTGLNKIQHTSHFTWISKNSPILSSVVVILSGVFALAFAH